MYAQKYQKLMVVGQFGGGHLNFFASRSPSAWPSVFPWPGSGQATGIEILSFSVQSVINTLFLATWTGGFIISGPPAWPVVGHWPGTLPVKVGEFQIALLKSDQNTLF